VLWTVLPIVTCASRPLCRTIDIRSVVIVYEVVVVVDGDVIVAVAPSTVVSPASTTPGRSNCHSNAKRNGHPSDVGSGRRGRRVDDRRIRVNWRAVDHCGVIGGNVNDLRFSLLNHNHSFRLDGLRFHFLLLGGFKVSSTLGFHAHALHCVHEVVLLREKGVT
jgi:hypothetical protein